MGVSLSELRERLRDQRDHAALRQFLGVLEGDQRRGAQALALQTQRRIDRIEAERHRMQGLFVLRDRLFQRGARFVAGVDEVGVGPLAGPVVAAAVILPREVDLPGLDDSKKLRREKREELAGQIQAQAVAYSVAEVPPREIDELNIYHAALEAMRRAVVGLGKRPDHLQVDARTVPAVGVSQTAIVQGDSRDGSIAAASIIAKVHRDELMRKLDRVHPGYGLGQHKGYPTESHIRALQRLGPSSIHRRSFAPVAQASQQHAGR